VDPNVVFLSDELLPQVAPDPVHQLELELRRVDLVLLPGSQGGQHEPLARILGPAVDGAAAMIRAEEIAHANTPAQVSALR
jgi:hypothetical protein